MITAIFAIVSPQKFILNKDLKTIKPGWQGNPLDSEGRFVNLEFPFLPKYRDVFKWMFTRNPQKPEKLNDIFRLQPVNDKSFTEDQQDCIIWLGHATFFIRLNNVNLLIDPVFFSVPLVKRYCAHAFSADFFKGLDYLLISHDHQDHCQKKSVRILAGNNPGMEVLTGLNMEKLLRPWSGNLPIQMAGWYQQYNTSDKISIYYLDSRHWSKRGLRDENRRLWGAFVIQSKALTIYFSGDSGYGKHFKDVKDLFPNIDIAIIGIGAYKPEWFMHPNHASPGDALRAFHDLGAKVMIPMHYGTFDISDEPVGEPLRVLQKLVQKDEITGILKVLQPGEIYNPSK